MFGGSMVALVTPMRADGEVDYDALERLIEFHVDGGTEALVIAGTTGESPTLRTEEHARLIGEAVRLSNRRIPIIAGTGSNSTQQTLELTCKVERMGVDGFLMVVPYYNKPSQEGLYRHFHTVASAVEKPVILYNVPGRTSCDLRPETVARLATLDNVVGIKEATGCMNRLADLCRECGDSLELYTGDDATALDFMLGGGIGDISVTANVAPRQMRQLCDAARAGREDEARAINERLMPLHRELFVEANPVPVKWALQQMGLIDSGIRLPLVPLDEAHHERVRYAMTHAGII
ncbi:4-hydroxy-tetrahydrodipicolinate synthase [Natronospira proteinivora]|uniref:4-hydroxy-tetrahydrodipicolinate synthase n=1 Tax=Natronospira proteinivora TaxID=1807133 RepID=A0ABT1G5C6_9GAMM|nr:4-hydroxy-tetrahydrodipicolinate synthase [Natronospira proteinivora]MCP1726485.1 4-hydroxy-tetrahydrodipicolinate synthase [Natronospira proteinivora]